MALIIKGIGNAQSRVNEITPEFDAHLLSWLTGCGKAILKGHSGELAVTRSGNTINIAAGIFFVYGYACFNSSIVTLTQQYGAGTSYAYVYLNIDLSGVTGKFEIKLTVPSTTDAYAWTQNNLFTNPVGRYQQPIARLTVTADNITVTDMRGELLKPYLSRAKTADDYSENGGIGSKFGGIEASLNGKAPVLNPTFKGGYFVESGSEPKTLGERVVNLNGNGASAVQQSGTIGAGWYRVMLAGGGGGTGGASSSGNGGTGGAGGYLELDILVPYNALYTVSAGGAGSNGSGNSQNYGGGGGGGGGASAMYMPQLGLMLLAGGGGGGNGRTGTGSGSGGSGGNGGGSGAGNNGGSVSSGTGGAGGIGGGGAYAFAVTTGGEGGASASDTGTVNNGGSGGNSVNGNTGGGAAGGANGWAQVYRLV